MNLPENHKEIRMQGLLFKMDLLFNVARFTWKSNCGLQERLKLFLKILNYLQTEIRIGETNLEGKAAAKATKILIGR